ncbi:MAG: hypothetical protein H7A08_09215 [Oceanospirillaceae bacterium]|nr:hypothetical protein [Oceanospirillaceae bacterium]
MPQIYFVHFQVQPGMDNPDFESVGGAYAICFIRARNATKASLHAQQNFTNNNWQVLRIEDGPFRVERNQYLDDEDNLAAFDEAMQEGESYILYEWPVEAQPGETIH